jgi:D-beta-D-heptose 7-phosphate kinase/D-beta-D-heptose 1-phosphate adenosyltransferase
MLDLASTLREIGTPRIFVLGDLILDQYVRGSVDRISPEAPVMVFSAGDQECRLGGAASVAYLLRSLGADALLAGALGPDSSGRHCRKLLTAAGIDATGVITDGGRCTTTKLRYLGHAGERHSQQILRVDHEVTRPLERELERRLIQHTVRRISECEALLIADYGKGVCTPSVIRASIEAGRGAGIPILVDPARGVDCGVYAGATLLKPNRREAEIATGRMIASPDDALVAAEALCESSRCASTVVTLDADGMAAFAPGACREVIPTRRRTIYDITGAGDTALAALGLCYARDVALRPAVQIANIAAGLQVERVGVSPVSRSELLDDLRSLRRNSSQKLRSIGEMVDVARELRSRGKRIAFTNGCYDLFHVGHLTSLEQASQHADVLVVGVNGDESVRRLKGLDRPYVGAPHRARVLAGLECVDFVVIFDEDKPLSLLDAIRPDVLVKGGGYRLHDVVGWEIVLSYGGRIALTESVDAVSTTAIASSIARG